jgi:hypothetical protein
LPAIGHGHGHAGDERDGHRHRNVYGLADLDGKSLLHLKQDSDCYAYGHAASECDMDVL